MFFGNKVKSEIDEIALEMARLKDDIKTVKVLFNNTTDEDLINSYILMLKSFESQYEFLIKKAKKHENVRVSA